MTTDAPTERKPGRSKLVYDKATRSIVTVKDPASKAEAGLAAAREELAKAQAANALLERSSPSIHSEARANRAESEMWTMREELTKAQAENVRLQELLNIQTIWVERCLENLSPWDADQHEAATETCQEVRAALAGGDNPVGEVVKWARKVNAAPAGPLPDELVEALKGLDGALAALDGAAK